MDSDLELSSLKEEEEWDSDGENKYTYHVFSLPPPVHRHVHEFMPLPQNYVPIKNGLETTGEYYSQWSLRNFGKCIIGWPLCLCLYVLLGLFIWMIVVVST